jgi:outer membrane protein assembly factor BamB
MAGDVSDAVPVESRRPQAVRSRPTVGRDLRAVVARWPVLVMLLLLIMLVMLVMPVMLAMPPMLALPAWAQVGNLFDVGPPAEFADPDEADARAAEARWLDAPAELDVFLPGDRGRERLLDRGRRLAADQRWSDAAAALDELLALDRDAFVAGGAATTRGSIRSEAAAIVEQLPRPGRDAYERLFAGRAAKQLAAAIAADDAAAIMAVARRWLHTPAGRQSAVITAVRSLEAGQPLAASAWLDRLATSQRAEDLEPILSIMRAAALAAGGEPAAAEHVLREAGRRGRSEVRLGGRDRQLNGDKAIVGGWLAEQAGFAGSRPEAGRDWQQFRGTPPRNGIVTASRPLLVPRYRVPLVRHPEEARRLERHRLAAATDGDPLLPAGTPVAVGDRLVVQTPLGILAVDFASGRRVWLESATGSFEMEAGDVQNRQQPPRAFLDATGGNLASDGRLVFAVETRPEALLPTRVGVTGLGHLPGQGFAAWADGNTLSAYDLATGDVRWRLEGKAKPATDKDTDTGDGRAAGNRWHMGPPLVVGDELFVLVEDRGEVRIEARAAANAMLRWSQPLATYGEGDAIASGEATGRRLAGLTPALAQGVLVCPIGGGCVVAIDVATRSLLWAHAYPRPDQARQGVGFRPDPEAEHASPAWLGEPAPVIAAGRVVLAPFDTRLVICLRLRDGQPLWQRPRAGRLALAGVVDGRLLVSDREGVEAIELATGRRLWRRALGDGVRPSGRGILTPHSLLLPCDAPAVVEIALADGSVVGRSVARDGGIPGNLVAHRGEVISRGIDSLDVFHQQDALEGRIETARTDQPRDPWADYWSGQVAIAAQDVPSGLAALARAAAAPGFRIPPGDLAAAVVEALRADFPTAARLWAGFPEGVRAGSRPEIDWMLVDGFLAQRDPGAAWPSLRRLVMALPGPNSKQATLLRDPSDGRLSIAGDCWLHSRLKRLAADADSSLRERIDEARGDLVASGDPVAGGRAELLAAALVGYGWPAACAPSAAAAGPTTGPTTGLGQASAWPLGAVDHRRIRGDSDRAAADSPPQLRPVPIAVADGQRPLAAGAALDLVRQRLVISDRLGRPLHVTGLASGFGLPLLNQSAALELAAAGGLLFVRSPAGLTAYGVGGESDGRPLWSDPELGTLVDAISGRWGPGSRVARDGAVPLGVQLHEPDERLRGPRRGLLALPTGLVVPGPRSIAVLEPGSGRPLWQRDELPAGLEWHADEEFLCGCTASGRDSLVLATADGRLLHAFDVPHRRQRLASRGRRFVAVQPLGETPRQAVAPQVRLDLIDPADRISLPLGSFDGNARATETGDGRLAVLEPAGLLTVLDLGDGSLAFRCKLPDSPRPLGRLAVFPWQDRYLVAAGTSDRGEPQGTDISPLETLLLTDTAAAPLTGSIWALDRDDGRPLWPVPAAIERHCLHAAQPVDLPVLVFCRMLQPHDDARRVLSVLCLDKRTGHAVFSDDRLELQSPVASGCDLSGDPEEQTVTIRDGGGRIVLAFSGRPLAPQPPFQSRGRPPTLAFDLDQLDARLGERLVGPEADIQAED